MDAKPVRVGIIGLGIVGQGVVRLLARNAEEITRRVGRPIVVTDASARDLTRERDADLTGIRLTTDSAHIAAEADVDIVVELVGGTGTAGELVRTALGRGKPVVTANKALIAEVGNELVRAAQAAGVPLAFEASVAGGIPVVKAIREGMAGNVIDGVAGIINGTCNYILTQMTVKGQGFAEALTDAQRLGYAEADPTFDVEGVDAAHKLTILASIAFGIPLDFQAVSIEGISKVTPDDIEIARALGYRIKHLGIARRRDAGVELRVHPTMVPDDRLLAKVDGVLNTVLLSGNAVGDVGLYGRGAGGDATASAVIADIVDVARGLSGGALAPTLAFQPDAVQALPVVPMADVVCAYFLRLQAADQAGVLSKLTAILADHGISVEAILQREPRAGADATIAVITSAVAQRQLEAAIAAMRALEFVRPDISTLRVEHFAG